MTFASGHPLPGFFPDETTQHIFASVVALAAEVSVLRERVARLEQAQGDVVEEPDPTRAAEGFVLDVFGHLARPLKHA